MRYLPKLICKQRQRLVPKLLLGYLQANLAMIRFVIVAEDRLEQQTHGNDHRSNCCLKWRQQISSHSKCSQLTEFSWVLHSIVIHLNYLGFHFVNSQVRHLFGYGVMMWILRLHHRLLCMTKGKVKKNGFKN